MHVLTDILEIHSPNAILYFVRQINLNKLSKIFQNRISSLDVITETPPKFNKDPCFPTPCGLNSECRNLNGIPACSCLPNYFGQPPACRPECIINSECPSDQACINQKCKDPCLGACGLNTECQVYNHTPTCICIEGYTGNAFVKCSQKPKECKLYFRNYCICGHIC